MEQYDRVKNVGHPNPMQRRGSIVTHPAQPWTATNHAFLRHLAENGFAEAPRVVGFDDSGNELLEWIDGEMFPHTVWPNPEQSLHDVGNMLRRMHEIGRQFREPDDAVWMPWSLHTTGPGTVISHGNIAPWHVVFRDGRPVGLIGWEFSGFVDPVEEVAVTGWYCAQLFDDDVARRQHLPAAPIRARWFHAFLDGYGLPQRSRVGLVDRIVRFAIKDNGWYARMQGFRPGDTSAEGLWTLTWQSRAALWTLENRELLERQDLSS